MSYIQVNQLSKNINKKEVLRDINLSFDKGKIYGLIGANGSGKTMLLRALCGFIKPTKGVVTIDNQPIQFNKLLPVSMGLILETPSFVLHQSALDNLKFLLSLRNHSDEYVKPLLMYFDLWQMKDMKVKDYSLGMRQKSGSITFR